MENYKKLKRSELKEYRNKIKKDKCPITNLEFNNNEVLDHIHKSHKSIYPETNSLCRDVINSEVNVLIGKIENQYLRSSKNLKQIPLPDLIRKVADYIEFYSDINNYNEKVIHPNEWKVPKIKKSSFNKLKKIVKEKYNKDIIYPKSGKITKLIEKYINELNFEIEFY